MKGTRLFRWFGVFVLALSSTVAGAVEVQTPWQNAAGGWLMTNLNWPGYNTGYEFTPQRSGQVVKLGGLFNGTKTVRLYNAQGQILAQAQVTASNTWGYTDITPVAVQAGQTYTVAVQTGWGGSSMYYGMGYPLLPITVSDITINMAVFGFGTSRPTMELYGQMWGQADIGFEAPEITCLALEFC